MVFGVIFLLQAGVGGAADLSDITRLIGNRDSLVISDSSGNSLVSVNEDLLLVPASSLKVFTSLVAIHHLGLDYSYRTEFYLDPGRNLTIKGFGDPLLVSEVIADIATALASRLDQVNDIILDDSYFTQPLVIPGVSSSAEPYDAPNGALCVNFNTVFFNHRDGKTVSAEEQTPVLPMAEKRIRASGLAEGRIVLAHNENEITLYAGRLFEYFLKQAGIVVKGRIKLGTVDPKKDKLLYRHKSPFTLEDVVSKLLEHSNNYITNQLLITSGVQVFGPPGSLEKGVRTAEKFARDVLGLTAVKLSEGSGISRRNRISAREMQKVLDAFSEYRHLMRHDGREYYKTGTLRGISTRVGYLENPQKGLIRYVILLNSRGKSSDRVARKLLEIF